MRAVNILQRRQALAAMGIALSLACAGCAEEPPDTQIGEMGATESAVGASGVSTGLLEDRPLPLTQMNGSGVAGQVVATATDGAVVIVIEARGLPGPTEYAAFVYEGACPGAGGTPISLNPIVGLADSTGTSTTLLEAGELGTGTALSLHLMGTGDAALACADLSSTAAPSP